ncbi:hypothetical protein J1N35_043676 [Gossypium stocksii]|uniref:Uncharacterized protein n=1 Tax=Gossypium stocksii TaxID=47602 RepID=A0A9D3U7V1_9ROSI|nr:hypothetical protein J1N35_043676 [Gossypium stocksii]
MRGLSQPNSCSKNKTLKSCTMKGKFENVVLIDVDSDRHENFIDIDAPEYSVGKLHEWWEKAYERKKYNVRNGQSGLEDHTNALGSLNDILAELEENRANKVLKAPHPQFQADVIFGRGTSIKGSPLRNGDQEFSWATSNCDSYPSYLQHGRMGSNGNDKLQSKDPSMPIPKISEEKQVGDGVIRYYVEAGTVVDKYSC